MDAMERDMTEATELTLRNLMHVHHGRIEMDYAHGNFVLAFKSPSQSGVTLASGPNLDTAVDLLRRRINAEWNKEAPCSP